MTTPIASGKGADALRSVRRSLRERPARLENRWVQELQGVLRIEKCLVSSLVAARRRPEWEAGSSRLAAFEAQGLHRRRELADLLQVHGLVESIDPAALPMTSRPAEEFLVAVVIALALLTAGYERLAAFARRASDSATGRLASTALEELRAAGLEIGSRLATFAHQS